MPMSREFLKEVTAVKEEGESPLPGETGEGRDCLSPLWTTTLKRWLAWLRDSRSGIPRGLPQDLFYDTIKLDKYWH